MQIGKMVGKTNYVEQIERLSALVDQGDINEAETLIEINNIREVFQLPPMDELPLTWSQKFI